MGQLVTVTVEGHVATLVVANPPANFLTPALMVDLERALDAIATDAEVKAAVIVGSGGQFSAGADIHALAQLSTAVEAEAMAGHGQAILDKIQGMGKPVIAAIQGWCLGGGMELAMACHMRVASEGARFGQPEIDLAIIPGFGGTQRLPRLVGMAKASELILTGDRFTAQEAKAIGLVNHVVPDPEVLTHAQGLAKKISKKAQGAVRAALRAMQEGMTQPLTEGQRLEAQLFGSLCETDDMREGIRAFLEKRQPRFTDH